MGACTFFDRAQGKTAQEAFGNAIREAKFMNGHGGYTGTIAEKQTFVMIYDQPEDVLKRYLAHRNPYQPEVGPRKNVVEGLKLGNSTAIAEALLDMNDKRVSNKWGPAGCRQLDKDQFLFFGWASS